MIHRRAPDRPDTHVYAADREISVDVAELGGDGEATGTVSGAWSDAGDTIAVFLAGSEGQRHTVSLTPA